MSDVTFHVIITRVDGPIFEGEAVSVVLPGKEGVMTVLAHHEPLISPLKEGVIEVRDASGKIEKIDVKKGTLEVHNNELIVLV